jgi:hypothetical protein
MIIVAYGFSLNKAADPASSSRLLISLARPGAALHGSERLHHVILDSIDSGDDKWLQQRAAGVIP